MWQVRIHGCVVHDVNPRTAFAILNVYHHFDDFVHAEFNRLMAILDANPDATSVCGAAITIAKMNVPSSIDA